MTDGQIVQLRKPHRLYADAAREQGVFSPELFVQISDRLLHRLLSDIRTTIPAMSLQFMNVFDAIDPNIGLRVLQAEYRRPGAGIHALRDEFAAAGRCDLAKLLTGERINRHDQQAEHECQQMGRSMEAPACSVCHSSECRYAATNCGSWSAGSDHAAQTFGSSSQ